MVVNFFLARLDYLLLELNLGMGYYRYDDFSVGPVCLSDASKSKEFTGGGWPLERLDGS